jgi:outer membrane receptor for ferrienterochelin and colicins
MRFTHGVRLSAAVLLLLLAPPLAAQTGTLTGRVTDAESGQPLSDVAVEVVGLDETQAGGVFTNAQGSFQFTLGPGSYSIVFSRLGYETLRLDGIRVASGLTETLEVPLASRAFVLNPVVVTASRRAEKALEAPAHVERIGSEAISERVAMTPVDHVKTLPGVDVAQTGITQSNVVVRGFNNVFSGALLIMTDNRYTHVPSLRFNANNMISSNDLDIDRIEVSLGPGAALYGPNAASGVMHLITKSPIDHPGISSYVGGGFRNGNEVDPDIGGIFNAGFRASHLINSKTGIKISGQYSIADDWKYEDPFEIPEPGDNPLVGARDFTSERVGGEIRIDHRPDATSELVLSGGYNLLVSSIELTGLGAGQADNWAYSYAQARYTKDRLFTQFFLNQSNAGDTYLLQTGNPITDKSRMMAAQIQHGVDVGSIQSYTYGVDAQWTTPRTDGTITGSNEDDDNINEIGGYLHSETAMSDKFDLVAAIRVDYHNRLEDLVVSPRAALVFKPQENQNFRFTFNRAFSTPSTNNLFLDLVAAENLGGTGYDLRTFGVPESGLTFDDRCEGAYCMYSPFAPGAQMTSAGPGPTWNTLLGMAAAANPALAGILPLIQSDNPDIATYFRRFNQEAAAAGENPFLLDAGPTNIDRMKPTITNSFEVGYKGLVSDRLLLSADVYYSNVNDFVGPLRTETPNVFMDPTSMGAYLTEALTPLVLGGLMTPEQLAGTITALVTSLAPVPVGTVAPDQRSDPDLILSYRNFGDVDYWGADLAFQFLIDDKWSLRANGSWVSQECFDFNEDGSCSSSTDIALNAPTLKGSFSGRWSDAAMGLSVDAAVRYSDGFPMNSGVYVGEIESYAVFDANLSYRLPMMSGSTFTVSAMNLFDNLHQEFIGAPYLGRLMMFRLQYGF